MEQPITTKNVGQPCVICGQAADAQATIAALQAEVKERTWWLAAYKQSIELAQSSLTQRTAERDTARRRVDELEAREVDVVTLREDLEKRTAELEAANGSIEAARRVNNDLQAELERVRGELAHAKKMEAVQKEVADNQTWHVQKLRTLIL